MLGNNNQDFVDRANDSLYKIDLRDDFSIDNIEQKNYIVNGVLDKESLYNDIKRVYVDISCHDKYFVKIYDNELNRYVITAVNSNGLRAKFNKVIIFNGIMDGRERKITLYDIVAKQKDNYKFTKESFSFYSEDDEDFSIFRGFEFDKFDNVDVDKIELFLKHVREIIASGNEVVYKYIISWIAYLIQNPGKKTKTCLLLIGKHGVGKTIFTDVIAKLFGLYADNDLSDIASIAGKFNDKLENKMLFVINNLNDRSMIIKNMMNRIKNYISENTVIINKRRVDHYQIENVSNFIITTNDKNPFWIDYGDWRHVVLEVSDRMKDNVDYFNELSDSLTPEFYENLFNYFRTYDIKDFNPIYIPDNERKDQIIDSNKFNFTYYMTENKNNFYPKGIFTSIPAAYRSYREFCERKGVRYALDVMVFKKILDEWCELKSQHDRDGGEPRKFYVLKAEYADN